MISARTTEPGYFALSIDGEIYSPLPVALKPTEELLITRTGVASGGASVVGKYSGIGMPNMFTSMTLDLPWQTDENFGVLADAIERLRASGGQHDIAYWKQRVHTYTLAAGQAVIYLPRRDAYAAGYAFVADDDAATATLNGAPLTVVYKPTVADGDAVPAGELWVSESAINHPGSGKPNVVRCKTGSVITDGDTLIVIYTPLYRMAVVDAQTEFSFVGREDLALTLAEVD